MHKRIPFVLGFVLLAIALWLQITSIKPVEHFVTRLENILYDMQLRAALFTQQKPLAATAVIVDIDDKSLEGEGRWPWPRAKLAFLMTRLQQEGAVVIALDIIFPEKESNIAEKVLQKLTDEKLNTQEIQSLFKKIAPHFAHDEQFAKSLTKMDVVLGISFTPEAKAQGVLSPAILELKSREEKQLGFIDAPGVIGNVSTLQPAAKSAGFINVFPDEDGIVRRVPLLIRYQNRLYPSLALEAVRLYLLSSIELVSAEYGDQQRIEGVKLANHFIPTDEKGQVIIPFRGKSFTFPYYSATDILNKKIPPGALHGKIVFLGTSATGLGELKATAVENVFPGVEIQASVAEGILTDQFAHRPAWIFGAELFITLILGILFIFIFPYFGPRSLTLFMIVVPLLLFFIDSWVQEQTGLIIYLLIPIAFTVILAMMYIVYGYLFETRKRERLKEMFGQYVPEKHIDEMLGSEGNYGLYGEEREMTVLFADIRNFTAISEPLSASDLKKMLNEFFTPMTEIIFKHRGTIDKYVGDMIMAFWGAPLKDKNHAQHAIKAALDMRKALAPLNTRFAEKGWAKINIGMGLNSGVMNIGDMGSKFRRNYTVLGDTVNLASRTEGLTKYYGVDIIVTENIQTHQPSFIFRKLDRVRVKGKKTGLEIYELLCTVKELTPSLREEIDLHHEALNAYFNQAWQKSETLFRKLHELHPHAKLYKLYLERIAEFKRNAPPADWDGIYTHAFK